MTPLEAAWQAVLAAPDDDRALHVLADALTETGDPHGELIALQLATSVDADAVDQFVARHSAALLGDEARLLQWVPSFVRGFLGKAGPISDVAQLEALLARPVSRLLRHLQLTEEQPRSLESLVATLIASPLRTLEELWLRAPRNDPGPRSEVGVSEVLAALPRLRALTLEGAQSQFEDATSASLRQLSVDLAPGAPGLESARFPNLERLSLELPFRRFDFPLALLAAEVTPSLRALHLSGALWPAQLQELAISALLRRLRRLDLSAETDTGWYPVLIQNAEAFAHLEVLTLSPDRHHPDWTTAVREVLPQATISKVPSPARR